VEALEPLNRYKDLERLMGVLSYVRKTVPRMEELISRIRVRCLEVKKKSRNERWWNETRNVVYKVIQLVLDK